MSSTRIVVFASGAGSNFQAIANSIEGGTLEASLEGLVCDQPTATVIGRANALGIPVLSIGPKVFEDKEQYERVLLAFLRDRGAQWVALAGYMRLIGPTLLDAYGGRILNLHPALLPDFPGLNAISAAFEAGVTATGVTVHLVDSGIDTGPVLAQQELKIDPEWSLEQLEHQIHKIEHVLYPQVLQDVIAGNMRRRAS